MQRDDVYDLPLGNYLPQVLLKCLSKIFHEIYQRRKKNDRAIYDWVCFFIFLIFFSDPDMQITWRHCMSLNLGRFSLIYSCICWDSYQRVHGINSMLYNWYVICIKNSNSSLNCSVKKLFWKIKLWDTRTPVFLKNNAPGYYITDSDLCAFLYVFQNFSEQLLYGAILFLKSILEG